MRKLIRAVSCVAMLAGLLAFASGCASIVSGTKQQVRFDSNPPGADVVVNGAKVGVTPCVAVMQRTKFPAAAQIKKEGYTDAQIPLMSRFNYWVIGNVLWSYCSLTAFTVDYVNNECTVQYDPDSYFTILVPLKSETNRDSIKEKDKIQEQSKVIRYLVVNYDQLVAEMSRGEGDHLSALYELLEVQKDKQADALIKIKDLYVKYPNAVEFGRALDIAFPRSIKTE